MNAPQRPPNSPAESDSGCLHGERPAQETPPQSHLGDELVRIGELASGDWAGHPHGSHPHGSHAHGSHAHGSHAHGSLGATETPAPDLDAASAGKMLDDLKRQINRLQRDIRLAIQEQLGQMSGRSLGSIAANGEWVRSIQELLDAHGLRVRCNHCGQAAILRVSPRSGAAAGVFVFDHTIDGRRTFHGGRVLMPEIRLMAKPARKPRGAK